MFDGELKHDEVHWCFADIIKLSQVEVHDLCEHSQVCDLIVRFTGRVWFTVVAKKQAANAVIFNFTRQSEMPEELNGVRRKEEIYLNLMICHCLRLHAS